MSQKAESFPMLPTAVSSHAPESSPALSTTKSQPDIFVDQYDAEARIATQSPTHRSTAPLVPKGPKLWDRRVHVEVRPLPWLCRPPSDPNKPFVPPENEANPWLKLFFGMHMPTSLATNSQSWLLLLSSPSSPCLTTLTRSMTFPISSRE